MKLATTIRRADLSSQESFVASFRAILSSCRKAGFEHLDFSFAQYTQRESPIHETGWEDLWKRLREVAEEQEITWPQAHAHFVNWEIEEQSTWSWHDELVRRSIVGAGILGVKTLIFHPKTQPDASWYARKASLATNLECFKQYADWAAPYGLTIAIENMIEKKQGRRFGSGPEELLELLEALNDPSFGICWDTGHAHMAGINQVEALRLMAPYLKALHIADNHGEKDEHLPPLSGTIDWPGIVKTLREIGYPGTLTFEVIYRDKGYPYRHYELFLENLFTLGQHLLELG